MIKVFGKTTTTPVAKKRISVRVPTGMLSDIDNVLKQRNMTYRKRSEWISSALVDMLNKPNFIQYIQEEWLSPGNNEMIQITLEETAEKALAQMLETANQALGKNAE